MFGVAAAVVGGSLVSGLIGSEASEDAANISAGAAARAEEGIGRRFEQVRSDMGPYRGAGTSALQRLMYLTGIGGGPGGGPRSLDAITAELRKGGRFNIPGQRLEQGRPQQFEGGEGSGPITSYIFSDGTMSDSPMRMVGSNSIDEKGLASEAQRLFDMEAKSSTDPEFGSLMRDFSLQDFYKDPGYQFRLEEGEKALQRGAVARGMAKSTPGLKALMRYSSDLASGEFSAAYGRNMADRSFKMGSLQHLAGMGQNAAAQTGSMGMSAAAASAEAAIAGGAALAQGRMGSASAWNNAIQGGLSNMMYQRRFDDMAARLDLMAGLRQPIFSGPVNWNNTGSFPWMTPGTAGTAMA